MGRISEKFKTFSEIKVGPEVDSREKELCRLEVILASSRNIADIEEMSH